jgi:hypothetical protein
MKKYPVLSYVPENDSDFFPPAWIHTRKLKSLVD